jgi:hypothetical protein
MNKIQNLKICIECKEEKTLNHFCDFSTEEENNKCRKCRIEKHLLNDKINKIIKEIRRFEKEEFKKPPHIHSDDFMDFYIRFLVGSDPVFKNEFDKVFYQPIKLKIVRIKKEVVRKSFIRKKILKRDHYECVLCLSREKLCIHHIIPVNIDPSKELDKKNLVTLCFHCHKKVHGIGWKNIDYDLMEKLASYTYAKP